MAEKRIDLIVKALNNLGGQAKYKHIYEEYESVCKSKGIDLGDKLYKGLPVWQSVVRREIQQHSSSSNAYIESNEDLFVPAKGIGRGVWALKDSLPGQGNKYLTAARKQQQELLNFFVDDLGFKSKSEEHLPYIYINKKTGERIKGDIDVIAYYRGYIFICESKEGKAIKRDFSKWVTNNKKNISYLTSKNLLEKHRDHEITNLDEDKIIFIYDTKGGKSNEYEWCKKQINNDTTSIYKNHIILNREVIKYYKNESVLTDKTIAANWFLDYCGINEPKEKFEIDAEMIQFTEETSGYLFAVNPKKFNEFAFVARREPHQTSNNFYQRLLKSKRLTDIADNYLTKDYGYFPNNIIANIQKKDAFTFTPETKDSKKGKLTIDETCSCRIIDGQHRLFSYLKSNKSDAKVIVTLLDTTSENESRLFIQINDKQQKIPPNLIWDLVGVLDPNTLKGVISNSIRKMNEDNNSFFYKKIKYSTSSEKGKLNLSGLCRALDEEKTFFQQNIRNKKKNYYFYDNEKGDNELSSKTGSIITNFFLSLDSSLGDFSEKYFSFSREYIFYINVKMCLEAIKYFNISGKTFDPRIVESFFDDYANIIKNTDFLTPEGKSLSGYGNYSTLMKKYIMQLRSKYKEFAKDVDIQIDKKINMPLIEEEIAQISIILFENVYGKNYIDHFYENSLVKGIRNPKKSKVKQHEQYLIPYKMALNTLIEKRHTPKEMENNIQITDVGESRFTYKEIVSKSDFNDEKERLHLKDPKLQKPKGVNSITYFEKYIEQYIYSGHSKGGSIAQHQDFYNYYESLQNYRSSFEEMHAQGWTKEQKFDELFNPDQQAIYKRQYTLLLNSLINCRKKLKRDFNV